MPGDGDNGDSHIEVYSRSGKVIVLREHQAAERILDSLLSTDPASGDFAALLSRSSFIGPPMLAAIARRLDAFDPHALEILSRVVASYPDPQEATHLLQRTANDRRNSDRRRMGAVMALEQALGIPQHDDFFSTLKEPVRSATGLLVGALESSASNPAAMHDYLRALVFQPLDLLYSVLGMLMQTGDDRTVAVLRLLALQSDPELQLGAIEALANTGTLLALRALSTLELTLSDEAARAAGRALLKLRLQGVDFEALYEPDARCRAWLSAVDGHGDRLLWLLAPGSIAPADARNTKGATDDTWTLLGLLLNDVSGILDAMGTANADPATFPAPAYTGKMLPHLPFKIGSQLADGSLGEPAGAYLESPFGYALWLLREAVRANWTTGTTLPVEYQLLNGAMWEYAANLESRAHDFMPTLEPQQEASGEKESDLLFNPLLDSWYYESEAVHTLAHEVAALGGSALPHALSEENWRMLLPALIRLALEEFDPPLRARYAARLKRMAEWLYIAGNHRDAQMAVQCAQTMAQSPPEANLFVIRLVQKGIMVALANPQ